MNTDLSKKELAQLVFTEQLKSNLKSVLKNQYHVQDVNFYLYEYGIGIEIIGTNSFNFIKNALSKITGISNDTICTLNENFENKTSLYVYMPEKDKSLIKMYKKNKPSGFIR